MEASEKAFVSILTPVYNGGAYLRECIESVLAQNYSNWEYIILNNFSNDSTLEIAQEYTAKDSRIKIFSNDKLLPIIANHNKAFSLISSSSKYCKVVSADDWLFPECIARMVALAESAPTVGIVGAYQLTGGHDNWHVRNSGLSYFSNVISGREISRLQLLRKLSVFGNPTSVLYRSDLVRSTPEFFPNPTAEADTSACYAALRESDFGFVHQILSYEREHNNRQTSKSLGVNAYLSSHISDLQQYGGNCLSNKELHNARDELMREYYSFLAKNVFKFRDRKFWSYHRQRLEEIGSPLSKTNLSQAIAKEILNALLNPKRAVESVLGRFRFSGLG